jgi:hypothetical protein
VADYSAIRSGLAAALETLDSFLVVHSTVPNRVVPPAAIVVPARPVAEYHQSFDGTGGNLTLFRFDIVTAVQSMTEEWAQTDVDTLVSGSGSVISALEADPTLGGACLTLQVTQATDYGMVEFADSSFIGCRFSVEVYAR